MLSRSEVARDQSWWMDLYSLFPNFGSGVQLFSQEISLGGFVDQRTFDRREMWLTLFSIKTRCAFLRSRFEQTIVHNCNESSILFVRGSSSKYFDRSERASEGSEQVTEMKARVADLIKSADWGEKNDGGSYRNE